MIRNWFRFKGNAPALFTDIARRNGDVAFFRIGPVGFYLLSSPELARDVLADSEASFERIAGERRVSRRLLHQALFASEGETHARQRTLMEPVMYRQAPPAHAEAIARFAARMADGWADGQRIDALAEAERMTTQLMVHILFGEDPSDPVGRRLAEAMAGANTALNEVALGATPLGDRLPSPSRKRVRTSLSDVESLVDDLARRRIAEGLASDDVLTMLLRSGDRAMTPEQARDEAIGLYRGHLGVGAVVSWTWLLLAQNPDVREQIEREADALGRDPASVDDAHALPTAAGSFREAIRLYPRRGCSRAGPRWSTGSAALLWRPAPRSRPARLSSCRRGSCSAIPGAGMSPRRSAPPATPTRSPPQTGKLRPTSRRGSVRSGAWGWSSCRSRSCWSSPRWPGGPGSTCRRAIAWSSCRRSP